MQVGIGKDAGDLWKSALMITVALGRRRLLDASTPLLGADLQARDPHWRYTCL